MMMKMLMIIMMKVVSDEIPRTQLDTQMTWQGAQECIDKGMWSEFQNEFGVMMVKRNKKVSEEGRREEKKLKMEKTVDELYISFFIGK